MVCIPLPVCHISGRRGRVFRPLNHFRDVFSRTFLQMTGCWSFRPSFQPAGWFANCKRSHVPDAASVSLRPPRCVCAAARQKFARAVILFSLGGWRKGRPEGRSLEEMRSSLTAAEGGRGSAGCGLGREKNRSPQRRFSRRGKTGREKKRRFAQCKLLQL